MFKQLFMTTLVISSLVGCSTTEDVYDSFVGRSIFNNNFDYQIKTLNTLEDNKILLESIQADPKLMAIINKNKNSSSLNHEYYEKYELLKSVIRAESEILNKPLDQNIKNQELDTLSLNLIFKDILSNCKQDHNAFLMKYNEFKNDNVSFFNQNKKHFQSQINECLTYGDLLSNLTHKTKDKKIETIKNKQTVNNVQPEKTNTKNEKIVKTIKVEEKKTVVKYNSYGFDNDGFDKNGCSLLGIDKQGEFCQQNKIAKEIDNMFINVKIHCNEEDAYLLNDAIANFKTKLSHTIKSKEFFNVVIDTYSDNLNRCNNIYNNFKMYNDLVNNGQNNTELKKDTEVKEKFKGYSETSLSSSVNSVSNYLFDLDDDEIKNALIQYSKTVFQIKEGDNLVYFDTIDYKGKKYYIFSNEELHFQVYYPFDNNLKFDKTVPIDNLYYSIFDYGYIDEYKTLILNKVEKI